MTIDAYNVKDFKKEQEIHYLLRDLYEKIRVIKVKQGSNETKTILDTVWKDSKFRSLVDLLGDKPVLGELGYAGATCLDVGREGFYTVTDGYGDGNPDGIVIEKKIRKFS